MKELKDLPIEERTLITIGCEPFYIGFTRDNKLKPVHNELINFIPSNHDKELWVFLNACANPIKYNMSGSLFSMRKANYTEANKRNKSKISYVKCKRVLQILENEGFIDMYKGFYDHSTSTSLKSCFIIKDKLRTLFDKVNIDRIGRPMPVETFVELRDMETKELITELSKLRGIKSKRELVKRYNDLLKTFDIRCKTQRVCAIYKRVFTDDLESHGRWYSQSCLQTSRSYLRKYLTISGEKTTEVDFKQMHPRILMELDKIYKPMSWEPYVDISDIVNDTSYNKTESRHLSKLAMMCLINAKSIKSAKSALWDIYQSDSKSGGDKDFNNIQIKTGDINIIFSRLLKQNSDIEHWFFKDRLWAILQHYDSEIAAHIIEKFVSLGKCILPWHDSFVVAVSDRGLLINTMRDAWKKVIGENKNCFYDIEF